MVSLDINPSYLNNMAQSRLSFLRKVFWNWDIHYSCNYRCSYCFLAGKWEVAAKENHYPGINRWIEIWNKIYEEYGNCHIHFSGGEPFTYPDFLNLIIELSKRHTLEFSTNLSFDITAFIEKMDPDKLRICASFHPEFVDFEIFLEKILRLKANRFSLLAVYVAYPPHLEEMKNIKLECDRNEIKLSIQPFRGIFQEQIYPDSYTEYEKHILKTCGEKFNSNKKMLESYTENTERKKVAKLCRMGQLYGKIYASADVYRCCTSGTKKIGNLLNDNKFQLLSEPTLCEFDSCNCWKAMLVGKEEEYLPHWS